MLFILHAGDKKKKTARKANNEGEEELPGVQEMGRCWSGCFAGGAAVEEEGADSCRGEGKLSAGAVGVTEEGAATSVAAGRRWRKEDCCWPVKKLEGGGLFLWRLSLLRSCGEGEAEVKICLRRGSWLRD
jgi:hypothetical protein